MPNNIPLPKLLMEIRDERGRFIKGCHYSTPTEFKKGKGHIYYHKKRPRWIVERVRISQTGKIRALRVKKICLNCGKEFVVRKSRADNQLKDGHDVKCCGRQCWRNYIKTHPLSGSALDNLKDKLKKVVHTREWNRKVSLSKIGDRNPMWNNGSSFEPYSAAWTLVLKRTIRERDNYTCRVCGALQYDKIFSVHHIDYDKKNCKPDNLITLCKSCHAKTNSHRDYWIEYFKNI